MGATTTIIYGSSGDGYAAKTYTSDYNEARNATEATSVYSGLDYIIVGWNDAPALFRGYLYFNTASIAANAVISAASVDVYSSGIQPVISIGHKVFLMNGGASYPSSPLATTDFNKLYYSGGGATSSINCVNAESGYKTFTLNETGFGWISLGATTTFCLMSGFDLTPTIPTSGMELWLYSTDKGTVYRPRLTVTYKTKPVAVTDAATDIAQTYVTGNGDTANAGSEDFAEHGFIFNDDGSDPVNIESADNKVVSVSAAGGAFTAQLTGLSPGTTYLYRSYISSVEFTGYGGPEEFTTLEGDPVLTVVTNAASDASSVSITLNGTIAEDGGDTIDDHGFIYKVGEDPGTPDDPSSVDGYVGLGAGVEGAFDASITSTMDQPASWDLCDEDWDDITDWTKSGTGSASEYPAGQLSLDSGGASSTVTVSKTVAADGLTTQFTVEYKIYFDELSTRQNYILYFQNDLIPDTTHTIRTRIYSNSGTTATLGIYDETAGYTYSDPWINIGTAKSWGYIRMTFDLSSHPDFVASVYYSDDGAAWREILTDAPCHYNAATTRGKVTIGIIGNAYAYNQKCHIEYYKVASGIYGLSGDFVGLSQLCFRAFAQNSDGDVVYGGLMLARIPMDYRKVFEALPGNCSASFLGRSLTSYAIAESLSYNSATGTVGAAARVSATRYRTGNYYDYLSYRGYVYWDTSGIPDNAEIDSAELSLFCTRTNSTSLSVSIYTGMPTYPTSSGTTPGLVSADYDITKYSLIDTLTGTGFYYNYTYLGASIHKEISAALIAQDDLTKIMLRTGLITNGNYENVDTGNSGYAPRLTIQYTDSGESSIIKYINIGDVFKAVSSVMINIGDSWKAVNSGLINIGDSWKTLT